MLFAILNTQYIHYLKPFNLALDFGASHVREIGAEASVTDPVLHETVYASTCNCCARKAVDPVRVICRRTRCALDDADAGLPFVVKGKAAGPE